MQGAISLCPQYLSHTYNSQSLVDQRTQRNQNDKLYKHYQHHGISFQTRIYQRRRQVPPIEESFPFLLDMQCIQRLRVRDTPNNRLYMECTTKPPPIKSKSIQICIQASIWLAIQVLSILLSFPPDSSNIGTPRGQSMKCNCGGNSHTLGFPRF